METTQTLIPQTRTRAPQTLIRAAMTRNATTNNKIVSLDELRRHRTQSSPEGSVTILFTDIEGSTELVERLGDWMWMKLLRTHDDIVREQLSAHGGLEVKHQGDGFMIAFDSSREAVRFAIATQRAFAEHAAAHPDQALRIRIGVHSGFAVRESDDFFGRSVIVAARVAALAEGGEILVSDDLREYASSDDSLSFGPARTVELKGLRQPRIVHGVAY
jgi:class 3 adenylate cyclase